MKLFSINSEKRKRAQRAEAWARSILDQSVEPVPYEKGWIPDEFDKRLEWASLHGACLVARLSSEGSSLADHATPLTEALLYLYDYAHRETGVGDASIARKMRKHGEHLIGLTVALGDALVQPDREAAVTDVILRNGIGMEVGPISSYLLSVYSALSQQTDSELLEGKTILWPEF